MAGPGPAMAREDFQVKGIVISKHMKADYPSISATFMVIGRHRAPLEHPRHGRRGPGGGFWC